MITGRDFANRAKSLIGLTYAQCDCIGVVRKALGIRLQGTNWLWRSVNNSKKYRYLTMRKTYPPEGVNIQDGIVLFRVNWNVVPEGYEDRPDAHHVGVLIHTDEKWSVVQSNPNTGVCLSDYHPEQWDAYGEMKNVDYGSTVDDVPNDIQDELDPEDMTDRELLIEIYKMIKGKD